MPVRSDFRFCLVSRYRLVHQSISFIVQNSVIISVCMTSSASSSAKALLTGPVGTTAIVILIDALFLRL